MFGREIMRTPDPCTHCVGRHCPGACGSSRCFQWRTWFLGWEMLQLSTISKMFEPEDKDGLEKGSH